MLDDRQGFVETLRANPDLTWGRSMLAGTMYCAGCGDERRIAIELVHASWKPPTSQAEQKLAELNDDQLLAKMAPATFIFSCVQCDGRSTAVIYRGPDRRAELAVFPDHRGGLSTPHTPDGVSFYLDQANRAQSVGALSAAVAMYRAALEHLLYGQGYTERTCGAKLKQLNAAIDDGTAPKWATELDPEFLRVINLLANNAIHPNDGTVEVQAAFDSELIALVKETFVQLLNEVYEHEHQTASRLAGLKERLARFNPPETTPADQ